MSGDATEKHGLLHGENSRRIRRSRLKIKSLVVACMHIVQRAGEAQAIHTQEPRSTRCSAWRRLLLLAGPPLRRRLRLPLPPLGHSRRSRARRMHILARRLVVWHTRALRRVALAHTRHARVRHVARGDLAATAGMTHLGRRRLWLVWRLGRGRMRVAILRRLWWLRPHLCRRGVAIT